ncbi:hypothetical protein VVT58_00300 [Sphingobium sp. SJ10-10]|uniref:hypothetical protein n=1 Tax=Sphingobium sp. SJ10-10 TaxID=3114999 RepID=UPI002E19EA3C|nr:hypothetical protein [Sphingobium sp. SJ10-10]
MLTGDPVRVEDLMGAAMLAALDALAALRITVFRAFPYLYDGSGEAGAPMSAIISPPMRTAPAR